MRIQNLLGNYAGKAIIEPEQVIRERHKIGQGPSCEIPAAAIVCYDRKLWEWVCALPGLEACDGWLSGAWLLPQGEQRVLVMKAAGFGGPTAVMTLEELIASGVSRLVSLGAAGGLQPDIEVGDIVICDLAIRDEGTSHHYLPAQEYAHACPRLTARLESTIHGRGLAARIGTSWTTDAPYRETVEDLRRYRKDGVLTVEMEAAALFAVAEYRGVSVSSIFAISDKLFDDGWHQQYYSEEKEKGVREIFLAALEAISTP